MAREKVENVVELVRANKVTAYWEGEGVAIGAYYKTHDKLATVRSSDVAVITAGFVMPEGTEDAPVTAQQKLEAFKNFLMSNASVFGIQYDPVDRRADEFKFPNKYDESTFVEFSKKMLDDCVTAVVDKINANVIPSLVKAGLLAEGTELAYGIADTGEIVITESYGNGSIKYAEANYQVAFGVGESQIQITGTVNIVSGQIKKPRVIGDNVALTQTGIKLLLVENGLLPKVEKKAKESAVESVESVESAE